MNNINFYTLKEMQQYLPSNNKESRIIEEATGCKLTHHMLFAGSTNSGKSNTLMNFLQLTSGVYDKIVMCVQKMEAFNKFLKDKLDDTALTVLVGDDEINSKLPDVSKIPDLSKKNSLYSLVIFDDCINCNKQLANKIKDYFTFGRAKGVTCIFLTQSYNDIGSRMLSYVRKQCSYIILCGIKSNSELERIMGDFAFGDINIKQLIKIYRYCKQKENPNDINFMKICTFECPDDQKLSKNWLEYIDPSQF